MLTYLMEKVKPVKDDIISHLADAIIGVANRDKVWIESGIVK